MRDPERNDPAEVGSATLSRGGVLMARRRIVGRRPSAHRGRRRTDMSGNKPWSTAELGNLEHGLRIGVSIEVIADFIERDVDDVRRTAAERGLLLRRGRLPEEAFN
jgi:hypothetical protein